MKRLKKRVPKYLRDVDSFECFFGTLIVDELEGILKND